MRRSHSYSKRELVDSCLRHFFYEYYAASKKLPFDPARKPLVQQMKEFTGVYLLAGEKLHWFIEQFLKKGPSSRACWCSDRGVPCVARRGLSLPCRN